MQNFIPLTSSKFYNEICAYMFFLNNLIENFPYTSYLVNVHHLWTINICYLQRWLLAKMATCKKGYLQRWLLAKMATESKASVLPVLHTHG